MLTKPRIKIVLISLVLAILTLWITRPQTINPTTNATSLPSEGYNWQALDTTIWSLDLQNQHSQTIIKANKFSHSSHHNQSDFEHPNVTNLDGQSIVTIRSHKAQSLKNNVFRFTGKVKLTSQFTPTSPATALESDKINYNVKQQTLSSDKHFSLKDNMGTMTGTGFYSELKKQTFTVDSDVQATYH